MADPFLDPRDAARPTLEQLREKSARAPKLYSVGDGFGFAMAIVARNEREAERLAADSIERGDVISWMASEIFDADLAQLPRLAAAYRAHTESSKGLGVVLCPFDEERAA